MGKRVKIELSRPTKRKSDQVDIELEVQSSVNKQSNLITKHKKVKTQLTTQRDRLSSMLSRFKGRVLNGYLRSLPFIKQSNRQLSNNKIKQIAIRDAIKKFIKFQNTHTKKEKRKKVFQLKDINTKIRNQFWTFIRNLQSFNFQQLYQLDENQLMSHNHIQVPKKSRNKNRVQASTIPFPEESYVNSIIRDVQEEQSLLESSLNQNIIQNNFQEEESIFRISQSDRSSKSLKSLFFTFLLCLVMFNDVFQVGENNGEQGTKIRGKPRMLIEDKLPQVQEKPIKKEYIWNTTSTVQMEEKMKKVSQNFILFQILVILLLSATSLCIIGLLNIKYILKCLFYTKQPQTNSQLIKRSLDGLII